MNIGLIPVKCYGDIHIGKPGTFTVQTFRDRHEDVPKAPRVAAPGIVENVMRAMAAREEENNRTAAAEHQSPAIETATPEVQSKKIGIQRECAECAQEKQSESDSEGKDVSEMSVGASGIQTKLTVGEVGDPGSLSSQVISFCYSQGFPGVMTLDTIPS